MRAGLCIYVLEPHVPVLFFLCYMLAVAAAVSCRLYHSPSSSQALYFVAATVQQQSHNKFVWTTSMRVLALHMRVCDVCVL